MLERAWLLVGACLPVGACGCSATCGCLATCGGERGSESLDKGLVFVSVVGLEGLCVTRIREEGSVFFVTLLSVCSCESGLVGEEEEWFNDQLNVNVVKMVIVMFHISAKFFVIAHGCV